MTGSRATAAPKPFARYKQLQQMHFRVKADCMTWLTMGYHVNFKPLRDAGVGTNLAQPEKAGCITVHITCPAHSQRTEHLVLSYATTNVFSQLVFVV